MKLVIVEMYSNGVHLARRLARIPAVESVFLVSDTANAEIWSDEVQLIEASAVGADDIVRLASERDIDLVVNLSSRFGAAGLMESLEGTGVQSIGSDKVFSETEFDKRGFKSWLAEHDFHTPKVLIEAPISDIQEMAENLRFPLVVKPDRQVGPPVQVCTSPRDLADYAEHAIRRWPYAQYGVVFLVEEYIEFVDHLHVVYCIAGGEGRVLTSVRVAREWTNKSAMDKCPISVTPHPKQEDYREQIESVVRALARPRLHAFGDIQCAIAANGDLYFLENNARPGTMTFSLLEDPIPCSGNWSGNQGRFGWNDLVDRSRVDTIALTLMHSESEIEVDARSLLDDDTIRYCPFSIRAKDEDKHVSIRRSFPSVVLMTRERGKALTRDQQSALEKIRRSGNYFPIDEDFLVSV